MVAERNEALSEPVRSTAPPCRETPKARKTKPIPERTAESFAKATPEITKKGLTAKQQLFIRYYLVDLNATQAAIRAGYSPNSA
jgi:phage terminase small subunit